MRVGQLVIFIWYLLHVAVGEKVNTDALTLLQQISLDPSSKINDELLLQFKSAVRVEFENQLDAKWAKDLMLVITKGVSKEVSARVKNTLERNDDVRVTITATENAKFERESKSLQLLQEVASILTSLELLPFSSAGGEELEWNAFQLAVELGFTELVEKILPLSIFDVNQPVLSSKSIPLFANMTPLHLAVVNKDERMIELLVQHNANVTVTDHYGRTPLDIAKFLFSDTSNIYRILKREHEKQTNIAVFHSHLEEINPTIATIQSLDDTNNNNNNDDNSNVKENNNNGGWISSLDATMITNFRSTRCDIDKVKISEMTLEKFHKDYVTLKRPVMITGGSADWKARKNWKKNSFLSKYGPVDVDGGTIPYGEVFGMHHGLVSLQEFVYYMDQNDREISGKIRQNRLDLLLAEEEPPFYVFDVHVLSENKDMAADFEFPTNLTGVWNSSETYPQFFVGGPRTGAPFHYHCPALNGLIYGEKRWFFVPPWERFYSKQPIWQWFRENSEHIDSTTTMLECTQNGGDIAFVPSLWTHAVLNIRSSIGVAVEFDSGICL